MVFSPHNAPLQILTVQMVWDATVYRRVYLVALKSNLLYKVLLGY